MGRRDDEMWLTAAECAARTGLTVRALRVYEEYGLITPQRTSGGWRCYGKSDLVRLNTITLLKSAGLSLAQIRTVTQLSEKDPSLQQVLELQLEAWKARQADAERGRQIVEATLKNLKAHNSVSIDELCNLVRNLAMRNESTPEEADDDREFSIDSGVLDRYVGEYRWGEYAILEVTREGGRLFGQVTGDPRHECTAESDTEFAIRALNAQIRFVTDEQGRATSMVVHQNGVRLSTPRLDAAAANDTRARLVARLASSSPLPGSEAALRRLIAGIEAGTPPYEEMSSALAGVIRQQLPQLQATTRYLGPVGAIEFRGVGKQGWDVYEVRRANGSGEWRILINSKGLIESAQVLAGPGLLGSMFGRNEDKASAASDQRPALGAEAALRRLVDGIRNGAPNFDDLSPPLAASIRMQLPAMQVLAQRLGAIVAIEYRETVVERHDVFEVKREHGSARWRIALAPDGTVANASAVVTGRGTGAGP
jgi:DNA-binding transcriptional MerR regulator